MSSGIRLLVGKPLLTRYCRRRLAELFRKKMSTSTSKDQPKITSLEESRRFMIDCFKSVGCNQTHAEIISANLLEADYRGHYSHGMNRLEMYIEDVRGGLTLPNAVPTIEKETVATAVVNGNNGFGAVVGQYCMDVAIEKAANAGIGLVVCNHWLTKIEDGIDLNYSRFLSLTIWKSVKINIMQISPSKEFKPLKVVIYGPPASGKTTLAERICRRYGAHYISVKTMIDETLEELRESVKRETQKLQSSPGKEKDGDTTTDEEDGEHIAEEDEEDETKAVIEDLQEQIKYLTNTMQKNYNKRLPDEVVVRLMKVFLGKEVCQTRGYVLDGYPKTFYQARELFGQVAEIDQGEVAPKVPLNIGAGEGGILGEDQQVGELIGNASIKIMPDYIVSLEATNEFLCERVMKLPQKIIEGTHYDEINMLRRLAEFNEYDSQENTVLTFFDEAEIHPIIVKIYNEDTGVPLNPDCIFDCVYEIFGEPIPGFGLTAEEEAAIRKLELEQKKLLEEGERLERQLMENRARKEYEEKMEKWTETLEKLQIEEEKVLAARSEPLRFYLMKYIFPTLSKGLVEVAKVKPDDPVDFLAEYLFKENPEGKMFDPSYTRGGERILQQYKEEVEEIIDQTDNIIRHNFMI